MTEKRPRTKRQKVPAVAPPAAVETLPMAPAVTVAEVRQNALAQVAGSLAQVTAIANGTYYVALKQRCTACGKQPDPALSPMQLLERIPRASEITQANALLAKISLPTQTEDLSLAEGTALIEATLGRFRESALAYGVPAEVVGKWHDDSLAALKGA